MSLSCESCQERYAATGEDQRCFDCIANKPRAANDNAASVAHTLERIYAHRDAMAHCLADVLKLFAREFSSGHSTPEQQSALRYARALLTECGL